MNPVVAVCLCQNNHCLEHFNYSYVYSPYQHFKRVGITGPVPKAFDGNLTEINKLVRCAYEWVYPCVLHVHMYSDALKVLVCCMYVSNCISSFWSVYCA